MDEKDFKIAKDNVFMKHCGFTLEQDENGEYYAKADVTPDIFNQYGIVHGGFLYTMADTITGIAARNTGNIGVTLNSSFNYLKNVSSGVIIARSKTVRTGNKVAVFRAVIMTENGEELCEGTFTYYFLS